MDPARFNQEGYDVQSSFADARVVIFDGVAEWHPIGQSAALSVPLDELDQYLGDQPPNDCVNYHESGYNLDHSEVPTGHQNFDPTFGYTAPPTHSSPFDSLRGSGVPSALTPPASVDCYGATLLLTPSFPATPTSPYDYSHGYPMEVATRKASRTNYSRHCVASQGTVKRQAIPRVPSPMQPSPQGDENIASSSSDEDYMDDTAESPSKTSLNLPPPRRYKLLSKKEKETAEYKAKRAKNGVAVRINRLKTNERIPALLQRLHYLEHVLKHFKIRLPCPTTFNLPEDFGATKFVPTTCEKKKLFPNAK